MNLKKSTLILLVTALIITSLFWLYYSMSPPKALFFLAYSPYWFQYYRGRNWTDVARDLELIKLMGFDGVRIHYEHVVEYGLVERLLNYTQHLGLKVIWATHATYWNNKYPTKDFPNETIVKNYKEELRAIANASSKYSHVLYISIFYPIPFPEVCNITYNECLQRINSSDFNEALEDIAAFVKSFGVKCAMESEGIPKDFPVHFISSSDAYFIQPYPTKWNDIDLQNILNWKSYFEKSGKKVHIGEYGFRTWKPEKHWEFGMASNDTIKAELIEQYFSFANTQFEIITYFAMYDGDGGWGLLNPDGTIRLSGWSASNWLLNKSYRPPNHVTIGILVVATALIILIIITVTARGIKP